MKRVVKLVTILYLVTSLFLVPSDVAVAATPEPVVYVNDDFTDTHIDLNVWEVSGAQKIFTTTVDNLHMTDVVRIQGAKTALSTKSMYYIGEEMTVEYDMYVTGYGGSEFTNSIYVRDKNGTVLIEFGLFGPHLILDWWPSGAQVYLENTGASIIRNKWVHVKLTIMKTSVQVIVSDKDSGDVLWSPAPVNFVWARGINKVDWVSLQFIQENDLGDFYIDNVKITAMVYLEDPELTKPVTNPLTFDTSAPDTSLFDEVKRVVRQDWTDPNLGGEYYDATVPDTLDLAQRAALALKGLTNTLNPDNGYTPYGAAYFNSKTPYLTDYYGSGSLNWGDIVNAIVLARNMSGSDYNLSLDARTITGMLDYLRTDDVLASKISTPVSKGQLALYNLYSLRPQKEIKDLLDEMSRNHLLIASFEGNFAYDFSGARQVAVGNRGVLGFGNDLEVNGTALHAISAWASSGNSEFTDLFASMAQKYRNYLLLPMLWQPQAAPKVTTGSDRGQFSGDMSAYATGLLGLLTYAENYNDTQVKQFVRASYEYIRGLGISAIGMFGSLCTTSEMTQLAIKLSQMGIGDYWDDVERYIRNEIAEKQITDISKLAVAVDKQAVKNMSDPDVDEKVATTENVLDKSLGLFLSDSSYPTHINGPKNLVADICCTAKAVQAIYRVWDAIVTGDENMAQVNLLLNRSSYLLDVNSYLPYMGKVELNIKAAKAVSIRLHKWVDISKVTVKVNETPKPVKRRGQYIMVSGLSNGDTVTIEFPVKEWTETYTLLWNEGDSYKKGTEPGAGWKAPKEPDKFTFYFKGYTVVDVTATNDKTGSNASNYLLYQRSGMKEDIAPTITVKRYMPYKTLTAQFEKAPTATTHTVSVSASPKEGGTVSGGGTYNEGDLVTVTAVAKSGYRFVNWMEGGFVVSTDATYTFILGMADRALTANFMPVSHPESVITILDSNGNVSITVKSRLDSNTGIATAKIDPSTLTIAFEKAIADTAGVKTIEVEIPKVDGVKAYELILPTSILTVPDASRAIKIKTDIATVTVPGNMLSTTDIGVAQDVSMKIAVVDKSSLDAEIQSQIGTRPIIELNLKTIDSKAISWNNYNAVITVSIPYIPSAEELADPEHITVWYIDKSGNVMSVPSGRYDPATGTVTFTTTHFSYYAVVYVTVSFDDITDISWAKKQIEVLASKGILTGTSEGKYSPTTAITRADYLYCLVRTLGIYVEANDNFDDISVEAYYYKEIGIAKRLGITKGTGNNKFCPDESISRQDMMTLTERALRLLNKLEQKGTASDLEKFTDKSLVASYAVGSIATLVKKGLIVGDGTRLNPRGNTTRAEAAVFLYRIYNMK